MTTKLLLYQGALRFLGQNRLQSLTEAVEGRYLLDGVWDDGAVKAILELGLWNFATRAISLARDESIESSFGYQYAFAKPTDWVRTAGLAGDPYLRNPLRDEACKDEGGYWWADVTPLFIRYVSTDDSYGGDLSRWPQSVAHCAMSWLGVQIMPTVIKTQNERDAKTKEHEKRLLQARSRDAMNEGSPSFPEGRWSRARRGGRYSSGYDIGSRSRLIG